MRWAVGVVACLIGVNEASGLEFWSPANGGNGHFYELVESSLLWTEAQAEAEDTLLGDTPGHLVTISDAEEHAFLVSAFNERFAALPPRLIEGEDGVWGGMTDDAVEGEWRWIDDTPGVWQSPANFADPIQTAFTDWCCGIAAGSNRPENYLALRLNMKFNDFFTNQPLPAYLVEWNTIAIVADTFPLDGLVNIVDLNNVRNNFGDGVILGPPIPGDTFPFDGVVDLGDLNRVRNFFGTTAETAAVPEPSTSTLATLMLLIVGVWRKRR